VRSSGTAVLILTSDQHLQPSPHLLHSSLRRQDLLALALGEVVLLRGEHSSFSRRFQALRIALDHPNSFLRSVASQWKGRATYFDFSPPPSTPASSPKKVASRIWTYETPSNRFIPIKNYLSFYASASTRVGEGGWKCFVGNEEVQAQDGDVSSSFSTRSSQRARTDQPPPVLRWMEDEQP